jgi:urocanate hydratase
VTDQTAAHDPLVGYVPKASRSPTQRRCAPRDRPSTCAAHRRDGRARRAMRALQDRGAVVVRLRQQHSRSRGDSRRHRRVPDSRLRARIHPAALLRRQRAVPLGRAFRRSADIFATDRAALEMFADDDALCRWIRLAGERVAFQGLPARIFWLGYGDRARFGCASTSSFAPAPSRRRS